jgi:hypothetical protein
MDMIKIIMIFLLIKSVNLLKKLKFNFLII